MRWARGVVVDWTLHLVRDLPAAVAQDRFAEIRSDLWEHAAAADARRIGGVRLAAEVLARWATGIPADLVWRHEQHAGGPAADGGGATMSRRSRRPAAKPWVHLTEGSKPFDQTNGAIEFDAREAQHGDQDVEGDLLAKGVAANTVNVGFFGGGMG